MTCPRPDSLQRFAAQQASPAEMEEIRRHADDCGPCRQAIESTQVELILEKLDWPGASLPSSPGECADAMTLAAYVEGNLSVQEKASVDGHLARCEACRDGVAGLVERLEMIGEAPETAREPRESVAVTLWETLTRRITAWSKVVTLAPRWVWIGAPAAAAAAIALLVVVPLLEPPKESRFSGGLLREPHGGVSGTDSDSRRQLSARFEVIREGAVPLSPDLRRALLAYGDRAAAESRGELLNLLEKGPVRVPPEKVAGIEVAPPLLAKLRSSTETVRQVHVTLLENGLLILAEGP